MMQYSTTAAASSATRQPAQRPIPMEQLTPGTNDDNPPSTPTLSIVNPYRHNNASARSSFSASTCSFEFLPSELTFENSLHTQEQRRRNPSEIVERENDTRRRLRSIARLEELNQDTTAGEDEDTETMLSDRENDDIEEVRRVHENAQPQDLKETAEEQDADVRSSKGTRISNTDSKRSFKVMSIPGVVAHKVFGKKPSGELQEQETDVETASTAEKRNTNNSSHSHGSTFTGGTITHKISHEDEGNDDYLSRHPSFIDALEAPVPLEPVDYGFPGDHGDLKAWMQVFASFFLLINTWGFVTTFGVFQTYYQNLPGGPLASPSAISLIGALQAFLLLFVGFLGGRLFDAGYCRSMMVVGTVLVVAGLLATAWCGLVYWRILLCQGIIVGTGFGCLFTPSVAIVSTYFGKKRAFANGLVATGSALGGIMWPIVVRTLITKVGYHKAVTILTGIVFACLIISNILVKPRTDIPPRKTGGLLQLSAFKEPIYTAYVGGMFCSFISLYIPYFYIEEYAKVKGIQLPFSGYYLVSIMNASSLIGRVIPNFYADKIGPMNMQFPSMVIAGILLICWLAVNSFGSLMAFVILYGFFSGTFISLSGVCMASFSRDLTFLGVRVGMMFSVCSVGSLIGTPIAGALVSAGNGSLTGAIIFSAVIVLAGCGLVAVARLANSGFHLRHKV